MQKYFNIVKITTTMDMTVGSRYEDWVFIEEDVLTPGAMFSDIHGYDLLVESVDEKEMVFRFKDRTYKINRWWQVLGTPEFDVSNKCVSGQARFVFHFSNHHTASCTDYIWTMTAALTMMRSCQRNSTSLISKM